MSGNNMKEVLEQEIVKFRAEHDVSALKKVLEERRESIKADLQVVEEELTTINSIDTELDTFVEGLKAAFGSLLTPEVLRMNLRAKFASVTAKKTPEKAERTRRAPATDEEKALILSVLTKEGMTSGDIGQALLGVTNEAWKAPDFAFILKALLKEQKIVAAGERKAKNYRLP